MKNENSQSDEKREYRRKRRVRNQVISYASLVILLIALITGGFFGVRILTEKWDEKKQEKVEEEKLSEEAQTETETIVATTEETTEAVTEYSEDDLLNEVVDSCISEMSLEDKVAGLFVITPEALTGVDKAIKAGDGTKEALDKYPVGGVIYFAQNIQSESQITEMLASTVSMSRYPIFLAVDEEGGSVARVADTLKLDNVGPMSDIGATNDPTKAYTAMQTVATYLCKYGFNVDFAPVADVLTNEKNTSIGDRSFGSDANTVTTMIPSAVTGLQDAGVTACLKHFPGLGDADADTHEGLAVTNKTLDEMKETEFKPFEAGIQAGVKMIMVGHVSAPQLLGNDDNTPCSLSEKVITDVLRGDLGYEGVVITDAMNMTAITQYHTADEAAVMALRAGADMILMPEDFQLAYQGVIDAVNAGTLSEERINDSLHRIYRIKYAGTLSE